jgi:ribosomal protein S18 acetylase RimI-like enzyme
MPDPAQPTTLRPATADDDTFLLHLFAGTRPEFDLLAIDEGQKQALIKMQFNAQRQQYDAGYPAAENSIILSRGLPIGRLLVDRSGGEVVLIDIALLPDQRNSGVGTDLIRKLLAEASSERKAVRLHVFKSNPALRLYERLGFSRVGDQSMYFEMKNEPSV